MVESLLRLHNFVSRARLTENASISLYVCVHCAYNSYVHLHIHKQKKKEKMEERE